MEEARDKRRAQVAEGEKGMKSRGQLACDLRREGETDRVRADWSAVQICWWEGNSGRVGMGRSVPGQRGVGDIHQKRRGKEAVNDLKPDGQALPREPVVPRPPSQLHMLKVSPLPQRHCIWGQGLYRRR